MWLGYGGAWPDDAPVEGRAPSRAAVEHRQRCLALGVAARLGQLDVQHQAVAVLGEQMAQVAELRRLPRPVGRKNLMRPTDTDDANLLAPAC